jgi:hypothetical protein
LACCHDSRTPPGTPAGNSERVDSSTQVQGMHACADDVPFMTGLRIDQNVLLCDGS